MIQVINGKMMKNFSFKSSNKTFIVSEVAQSYEGSKDTAIRIVAGLAESGTDAIMFQVVYADELVVPNHPNYNLFKSLEMSDEDWNEIFGKIKSSGIIGIGEVFGERSATLAIKSGAQALKIHAADLNNLPLLRFISNLEVPIVLSVGGANEHEIKVALDILLKRLDANEIVLMHGYQRCPTSVDQTHLNKLRALKNVFEMPIGYADHINGFEEGKFSEPHHLAFIVPCLALSYGVKVIEKHVILDRSKPWEDHESALSIDEFKTFVRIIREVETAFGANDLSMNQAEADYRIPAKKYLIAARPIEIEHKITINDVTWKRIASSKDGIAEADLVLGRISSRRIEQGEPFRADYFR